MDIAAAKKALRQQIRRLKDAYAPEERAALSEICLQKLEADEAFLRAERVLLYCALPDEVQTLPFLIRWQHRKQLFLPKVCGEDLTVHPFLGPEHVQRGAFGILEPTTPAIDNFEKIALAIVPGMAFDAEGHRLGRGRGFYDRLLRQFPHIYIIGIAFPFQLVDHVPAEVHDVRVHKVIT